MHNRNEEQVQSQEQEKRVPLIYDLVETYKKDFEKTYGFSLCSDSLHFNIEICKEGQDTIFIIYGSPFEGYYSMYDNFCKERKESVYMFNIKNETIILYFLEPNYTKFAKILSDSCYFANVRDYVLNYFSERYFDVSYFVYKYESDGSFELLRKSY